MHRLGLQCRVAVLLCHIGLDRFGGRVQQIPLRRPTGRRRDVLVHGIVRPASVTAVEQAHVQSGYPSPWRASGRESDCGVRSRMRTSWARATGRGSDSRARAKPARRHRCTGPSHGGLRHRIMPLRTEAHPRCSIVRAPGHVRSLRYHPGCLNRRRASAANARRRGTARFLCSVAGDHDERQGKWLGHAVRRYSRMAFRCGRMPDGCVRRGPDDTILRGLVASFDPREPTPMTRALVVRPSSLGDMVHAIAVVPDLRRHLPDAAIDWVAEEAFAPLVELDSRIGRVIPVALRRWRDALFTRATWRELAAFRAALPTDAIRPGTQSAGAGKGLADRLDRTGRPPWV